MNSYSAVFRDSNGRSGDYYVVTAQNSYGESGPSNTARAMEDCGWNCWYAGGHFGVTGGLQAPLARVPSKPPLAKTALQTTPPLSVTVITYAYDPLYRLTGASYTGALSGTYSYTYDAVGNMTAYTETVGTNSTRVNRTFNAANQLVPATDAASGTTSYYYDANGNLTRILPPGVNAGEAGEQVYRYNQRNLLLTVTTGASSPGTPPTPATPTTATATGYSKPTTAARSPSPPPIPTTTWASPRYSLPTMALLKPLTSLASISLARTTARKPAPCSLTGWATSARK